jgi:cell division protein FtsN
MSIIEKARAVFRGNFVKVIVAVLLLAAIGSSVYFYMKLHEATADPSIKAKEDLQEVIEKVSRIMVLPDDEEPTLATVSDPEKLTDQPFFKRAEKGDKVLLYSQSKKAILYSVSKDKILEVAPFSASGGPQN